MALVVETGTGSSTSESYISVADAAAYHTARGNKDAWDEIENKEAALRLATEYMIGKFRSRWKGSRAVFGQALDWPRMSVLLDGELVASNVLPREVVHACAELALKTKDGPLSSDTGRATASESVGEVSVSYFEGQSQQQRYESVEAMLAPLFSSAGSTTVVSRA